MKATTAPIQAKMPRNPQKFSINTYSFPFSNCLDFNLRTFPDFSTTVFHNLSPPHESHPENTDSVPLPVSGTDFRLSDFPPEYKYLNGHSFLFVTGCQLCG